jgi:Holliday junction resolvase
MRLLADENVSRLVIERLRTCGFEVISVSDTNRGAPDTDVLSAADAEIVSIHADKLSGNLVVIEPGRVRLRALPR